MPDPTDKINKFSFATLNPLVLVVLGTLLSAPASSQQSLTFTAGYALGVSESVMASELLKLIASQIENVEIEYLSGTTTSYGLINSRFSESRLKSDLVFLYAGMTEQIGEISLAGEDELLQPLDALPNFSEALRPEDIYSNLLEPAFKKGHLWAVPVRLSLPMLVVDDELQTKPRTWVEARSMANDGGIRYTLPRERYLLWLTLLAQEGRSRFESGQYLQSTAHFLEGYLEIERMLSPHPTNWSEPFSVGIVTSNSLIDIPQLNTGRKFYPFPTEGTNDVHWADANWYVGVSAHVAGPKRQVVSKVLAAFLSTEIQLVFARTVYSPPVRPSIARSAAFLQTYEVGTAQRAASEMTERLRFRNGGILGRETESIMQAGFEASNAVTFEDAYSESASRANKVIENQGNDDD